MQLSEQTANEPPRGTLHRLIRMGLPELTCRGRQAAFKWVDRIAPTPADGTSRRCALSPNAFAGNARKHFFQGPFDTRIAETLFAQWPRHCEEILATADDICSGRFDLLGYRALDLGNPPEWHLDPISNRRSPRVHWSKLDPLDVAAIGDSKVTWELNRHQWMVTLAQAWRLTGDEQYARTIVRCLQSWVRSNPPGVGVNWLSSLEVAFRLIAWCWTLLLIRDAEALTEDGFAEVIESMQAHATHVERYLSYYFSPNTHLTGEALGLLYAGVLLPQLKRAERWRSLGTRILLEEIERQVLPDGVYFERSTCYQRYTIDFYLHFIALRSQAGLDVPPIVDERVKSMLDFLIAVRQPDGSMPSIGDADAGCLLPLSPTEADDFQVTFSNAAVILKSGKYAWAAKQLSPETLWLLGTTALDVFGAIEPSAPASSDTCRAYTEGGFTVMRSGWDGNSHSLILDNGPLGCHLSSGHGHADLLSIQCSAYGRPYLVDAGTGCYTADSDLRNFFRGTAAHSTVMIDGRNQAEPAGPFSWRTRCAAHLAGCGSNDSRAVADAEHDAYRSLNEPVSHRRRVIFVKPNYWVVVDDLTGAGHHHIDARFQFAPMDVKIDPSGWLRATAGDGHALLLRSFASTSTIVEVREGRQSPIEGWISPKYGQLVPAPVAVLAADTELPVRIVTLLWPLEHAGEESPRIDVDRDQQGRPIALFVHKGAETVVISDAELTIEHAETTIAVGGRGRPPLH